MYDLRIYHKLDIEAIRESIRSFNDEAICNSKSRNISNTWLTIKDTMRKFEVEMNEFKK